MCSVNLCNTTIYWIGFVFLGFSHSNISLWNFLLFWINVIHVSCQWCIFLQQALWSFVPESLCFFSGPRPGTLLFTLLSSPTFTSLHLFYSHIYGMHYKYMVYRYYFSYGIASFWLFFSLYVVYYYVTKDKKKDGWMVGMERKPRREEKSCLVSCIRDSDSVHFNI